MYSAYAGPGAVAADFFHVERAENGFIVDMMVTEMGSEMSDADRTYLGSLLGAAKAAMSEDSEPQAVVKVPPLAPHPIKRPVRFICATLDDVIQRLKQHWEV